MGIIKAIRSRRRLVGVLLGAALLAAPAWGLPEGGTVTHGTATINNSGQNMTIQQTSQQAIINWNGFSINAGEMVQFLQPSQLAAVLNRVTGVDPSVINGILQGNGSIYLINPNGVLIGPGGMVNAGGFLASTLSLSDADFLAGNMTFKQDPNFDMAAVVNQGKIQVTDGGFVVLTAPSIANEGVIIARAGQVKLGAGTEATVNFDGQNLIHFALGGSNTSPTGSTVLMSRADSGNVLAQVVNQTGIQEAGSLYNSGEIVAQNVDLDATGNAVIASGTVRDADLVAMDVGGNITLGSNYQLDGHRIVLEAGGNIVFDTLVAERAGNDGGLVSLTANGSEGIRATGQGLGIAADRVELYAGQGSISTPVSANAVSADAPNGNISLSLRPGLIDSGVQSTTTGGQPTTTGGQPTTTTGGTTITPQTSLPTTVVSGTTSSPATSASRSSTSSPNRVGGVIAGGTSSASTSRNPDYVGGTGGTGESSSTGGSTTGGTGTGGTGTGGTGTGGTDTGGTGTGGSTTGGGTTTGGTDGGTTGDVAVANGTLVGQNGTYVSARAGGDVNIDSVNTVYVEQISGRNVTVSSQTGSVVDAGDSVGGDNRNIIASGNASLSAADFVGTFDDPLEIAVGGNLSSFAGSEVDGISGVLVGPVGGSYFQSSETAGVVLLNPGEGGNDGIAQAQRGIMDNSLPGDTNLGGGTLTSLFFLRLNNSIDEDDWLEILRGTVVWEDSAEEAEPGDL